MLLSVVTVFAACTKDIERFNENVKSPADAPADMLYSSGVRNMTDALVSGNVNLNVFRFAVQHWAATTYQDEPRYEYATRNIPTGWWTRFYRDVLTDLQQAKKTALADNSINEGIRKNKVAQIDMMEVYAWSVLVNTFGNVPYTEALDANNLFPKYDDAKTIYYDLIDRLAKDITDLNPEFPGISGAQDLFYGGDIGSWITFGHSLNMKMAITIADSDAGKAKSMIEASDAHAFQSSDENATINYLASPPNTNPLWVDLVQSGRKDMVAGAPLLDRMVSMKDPRLSLYYRPNSSGDWKGGIVGSNNTYATTSIPSDLVMSPDFGYTLLSYSEIEFIRAEAKERGMNVTGTAKEHYDNAVTASILDWGGTAAQAAAYLAGDAAYSSANWQQKIGLQKWISLHNDPFNAWVELRRFDYPVLAPPTGAVSDFPNRFVYPTSEAQLNGQNYNDAGSAIGGDEVGTKLFWDTK